MINIKLNVDNYKKLEEIISYVENTINIKKSKKFRDYIQTKCLEEIKSYARTRLQGTSNEEYYNQYIESIHIPEDRKTADGFEIISDLVVKKEATHHSPEYNFSISLAFEYGTGIVGMGSADAPSWYRYNVNNNYVIYNNDFTQGWWIPAEKVGESVVFGVSKSGKAVLTRGYEGLEIFRFGGANIQQKLPIWIEEYLKGN